MARKQTTRTVSASPTPSKDAETMTTPTILTAVTNAVLNSPAVPIIPETPEQIERAVIALHTTIADRISMVAPLTIIHVSPNLIHPHPSNPRDKSDFLEQDSDFRALLNDMTEVGFKPSCPVVVHPYHDGPYVPGEPLITICGHRRLAAARIAGIPTVPAILLTGLTKEHQLALVLDHAQVKGLSFSGVFRTFKTLVENRFTKPQIMRTMGMVMPNNPAKPNDYLFDTLKQLYNMPPVIQSEALRYKDGGKKAVTKLPFTPTGDNLDALELAINEDIGAEHTGPVETGPAYVKALATLAKPETKPGKDTDTTGAYSVEHLTTLFKGEHRAALRQILGRIAGVTKTELSPWLDVVRFALDATFGRPEGLPEISRDTVDSVLATLAAPSAEPTPAIHPRTSGPVPVTLPPAGETLAIPELTPPHSINPRSTGVEIKADRPAPVKARRSR